MNVKSLLCAAAMLSVCGVAQALPNYTLYPASGEEFSTNQMFDTFNLTFDGVNEIVVAEDAMAELMSPVGDDIYSTDFMNFMDSGTIIIKFDSSEILINGEWNLTIPAGSLTVNGEEYPAITAFYTLKDPNLNIGEYPQIELVSIDPAPDSKLPVWGGNDFDKVKMQTTDDAAVNYIEWTLWDVTKGEEDGVREWKRQGNDNRFDVNRTFGDTSDLWADGLYISVGGNEKLIEGHKYRLDLTFCGIGYDFATNQYPTPLQIELSTELETSVYYYGLTPATEYSPYTYESVMPDPNEYVITSPEFAEFMITYSGPVKPVAFNYSLGMGAGVAPAGEWEAADGAEVDEDGCTSVWKFKFDASVVSEATGNIATTVQTIDKDGLYVKGNGGYVFDDNDYLMEWVCNCGAPALISVDPTEGSEVDELSSITLTNEAGYEMAISWVSYEDIQIVDRFGSVIRTLALDYSGEGQSWLTFSDDATQVTLSFEPITEPGNYALIIPMYFFTIGDQFTGTMSNATSFTYIVKDNETPGDVTYDLLPVSITPEDNTEISSLSKVTLDFGNVVYSPLDGPSPMIQLLYNGVSIQEIESVNIPTNDFFEPTEYYITFEEVTELGNYTVVIPEGIFFDGTYDESNGTQGHANPEMELNYVIGNNVGVEAIIDGAESINVYDMDGVMILNNANVEAAKELKSGLYIINGKKVMICR